MNFLKKSFRVKSLIFGLRPQISSILLWIKVLKFHISKTKSPIKILKWDIVYFFYKLSINRHLLIINGCTKELMHLNYYIKNNNEMLPDLLIFRYAAKT